MEDLKILESLDKKWEDEMRVKRDEFPKKKTGTMMAFCFNQSERKKDVILKMRYEIENID